MIELVVTVAKETIDQQCQKKSWYEKIIYTFRQSGEKLPPHIMIALVSEAESARINELTRLKKKATDVLSFDYSNYAELVLCPSCASRNMKRFGSKSLCDELLRIIIHGLLHIAGYDHVRLSDRNSMRKREQYFIHTLRSQGLCSFD